ncbi:hypothetical protein NEUTE1DRAFT_118142 [Neurospora tetrasperma FGSC 2508]|uniref:Uncharacterized protein n=1 Tax=Neurospora tetrasperma (strain FGSC 2508 / ATCC MYA-4615 / P0657) TaxID=510951 RepID=F8MX66_NEUT8|nr:uncharacterized protein NEUTE1DRAFT_118142 [Neurospora tetrasperma FGSC 2508]EGO54337.1 hypothetical protein NEUTE1DRAFT_118142 [Neurospora tetrasperma FGSC 2508]EGZ68224.1 hypothetical protein NEUTE2DRAFT_145891 [Neurospora tetrasperma FGSC 2509]
MEGGATADCYCGQIDCCIPPFLHDDTTWRRRERNDQHTITMLFLLLPSIVLRSGPVPP